mmetsp:Transcript_34456/g.82088  ORF Transcript_34456/g.82088 Transcript_34456/m.82088 type:complete len:223 (+) Transcript_34456:538-1206(+)
MSFRERFSDQSRSGLTSWISFITLRPPMALFFSCCSAIVSFCPSCFTTSDHSCLFDTPKSRCRRTASRSPLSAASSTVSSAPQLISNAAMSLSPVSSNAVLSFLSSRSNFAPASSSSFAMPRSLVSISAVLPVELSRRSTESPPLRNFRTAFWSPRPAASSIVSVAPFPISNAAMRWLSFLIRRSCRKSTGTSPFLRRASTAFGSPLSAALSSVASESSSPP